MTDAPLIDDFHERRLAWAGRLGMAPSPKPSPWVVSVVTKLRNGDAGFRTGMMPDNDNQLQMQKDKMVQYAVDLGNVYFRTLNLCRAVLIGWVGQWIVSNPSLVFGWGFAATTAAAATVAFGFDFCFGRKRVHAREYFASPEPISANLKIGFKQILKRPEIHREMRSVVARCAFSFGLTTAILWGCAGYNSWRAKSDQKINESVVQSYTANMDNRGSR